MDQPYEDPQAASYPCLLTYKMDTPRLFLLCARPWGTGLTGRGLQSGSWLFSPTPVPASRTHVHKGAAGGQRRRGEPHDQSLAHGESTGLILRGSREGGLTDSHKSWAPSS